MTKHQAYQPDEPVNTNKPPKGRRLRIKKKRLFYGDKDALDKGVIKQKRKGYELIWLALYNMDNYCYHEAVFKKVLKQGKINS